MEELLSVLDPVSPHCGESLMQASREDAVAVAIVVGRGERGA